MTELDYILQNFDERFRRFKGRRIALYPGKYLDAIVRRFDSDYHFHCILKPGASEAPKDAELRWAAFLLYCGADAESSAKMAHDMLKSLKMSVKMMDTVSDLVQGQTVDLRLETLQEMLMLVGPERLEQLILLRQAMRLAGQKESPDRIARDTEALKEKLSSLLNENACYTLAQLAVNGKDMAALGLRGPAIGETLHALLLQVVRGQLANEQNTLLNTVKKAL